jgi:hypothetical protein
MSTDAAQGGLLRRTSLRGSFQPGALLQAVTVALLLAALWVLAAGGMGQRVVPRPPSVPSDGPPPRMALSVASVAG